MKSILGMLVVSLAATVAMAGCKKKEKDNAGGPASTAGGSSVAAESGGGEGACGPLKVTVDGQDMPGFTHGLASTINNDGYFVTMVSVFNKTTPTCEGILAQRMNNEEGRTEVRGFVNDKAPDYNGVGIDSYTHIGGKPTLKTPAGRVGEKVTICASKIEFTPNAGPTSGKKVVIDGAIEGNFCGQIGGTPAAGSGAAGESGAASADGSAAAAGESKESGAAESK